METREPDIGVEVVYALPHSQTVRQLSLPRDSTVEQAIEASGIMSLVPGIDLRRNRLGIYGKLVQPGTLLHDRDRIEIYRPLTVDPGENRRRRAKKLAASRQREHGAAVDAASLARSGQG